MFTLAELLDLKDAVDLFIHEQTGCISKDEERIFDDLLLKLGRLIEEHADEG